MGRVEKCKAFHLEIQKRSNLLEDLDMDGWILK
jgi:hypothetical protein